MSTLIEKIDRHLYPGSMRNWDDQLFRERILRHVDSGKAVLDLGAGAGIVEAMNFRGIAGRVCGVDLDPRVETNPMLDEGRVSDAAGIPYPDQTFDVVFADNVMEHLDNPISVYREVYRVLKPGGLFLFKTPNKTHYMPIIARLTPHRFHQVINQIRGRSEMDTFPTHYRSNSITDVQKLGNETGFVVDAIERIEGRPEYLRITWPTYLLGALYERLVNSTEWLAKYRILLVVAMCKKEHFRC